MSSKLLRILFCFIPIICSSCNSYIFSVTRDSLEDNQKYYKIYDENNQTQFKFTIEISIDSPKSRTDFDNKSFRVMKGETIYYSVGFASSWVHYNDKYFYGGIKNEESVDRSFCTIYPLFDIEIGENKIFYNSFELKINKTICF